MKQRKNMQILREIFRLSEQELANLLGCTVRSIERWERTKLYPSLEHAIDLADTYGVSLDIIFDRVPLDTKTLQLRKGK